MIDFDEFADAKRHPFSNLESKLARAYRETVEELVAASKDLWKTMRVDDQMLPYFLPEYEDPALVINAAEDRLAKIQSDIENFVEIVGGYSRFDVAQKLHRCELDIANAKRKAKNVRKRATQENPNLNLYEIEKLDVVQAAYAEREAKISELNPLIAELDGKLQRAKEILKKYG